MTNTEAGPCRSPARSSSGRTRLATSAVGTSCAVVQGHLRNRLGQSDRIAEFSEHTEGLRAFEWIRKKRIVLVQKENTVMPSWDQLQHCKWFYTGAKCGPCYELEWEQRLSESSWAAEHFPRSRQCKKSLVTVFGQTGTCCWELGFSSGGRCSWPLFCKRTWIWTKQTAHPKQSQGIKQGYLWSQQLNKQRWGQKKQAHVIWITTRFALGFSSWKTKVGPPCQKWPSH